MTGPVEIGLIVVFVVFVGFVAFRIGSARNDDTVASNTNDSSEQEASEIALNEAEADEAKEVEVPAEEEKKEEVPVVEEKPVVGRGFVQERHDYRYAQLIPLQCQTSNEDSR